VITKTDLAVAVEFDRTAARENIQAVRPGIPMLELSSKNGQGMDEWMTLLASKRTSR
jgi:hydrogenase nickel incorporation protein HypB